jgi:hypothetical protein
VVYKNLALIISNWKIPVHIVVNFFMEKVGPTSRETQTWVL